jgi:integrase
MLIDTAIRKAKPKDAPYKLNDGKGLFLLITPKGPNNPKGSKLWRYRYKINGKENLFAVGEYFERDDVETEAQAIARRAGRSFTLAEARAERESCRALVKQGIHPSHQQRTETLRRSLDANSTFQSVAETWIEENEKDWSENYTRQIRQRFAGDVYPHIGFLPIKSVTPAHVKDVLKRVEKRGAPATAKLLRTWIGGAFRYAAGELMVETDPTWPLRNSIKSPKTQHIAHLVAKDIPAFLQAIERVQAEQVTQVAVKLLWLTAVRTVELRCAEWQEFDLDAALWVVPAARMKMREAHTVHLSAQAVELLRAIQPLTGRGRYVFPGRKDREQPLTHETFRDVFKRAGYGGKFTPHGTRSTFSTYFNEAGAKHDVIELILAHKEKDKIRRAYNHAEMLEQRRQLLQQWADLTDAWRSGAAVIPLRGKAA